MCTIAFFPILNERLVCSTRPDYGSYRTTGVVRSAVLVYELLSLLSEVSLPFVKNAYYIMASFRTPIFVIRASDGGKMCNVSFFGEVGGGNRFTLPTSTYQ